MKEEIDFAAGCGLWGVVLQDVHKEVIPIGK